MIGYLRIPDAVDKSVFGEDYGIVTGLSCIYLLLSLFKISYVPKCLIFSIQTTNINMTHCVYLLLSGKI